MTSEPPLSIRQRVRRALKKATWWSLRGVGSFIAVYLAFLLIGLIPRNWGADASGASVSVYVASSAIHADIIVPIKHGQVDWSATFPPTDFRIGETPAQYFAIGWGDRGFYLDTPQWSDLKATTAANALLLPSQTVLHVGYVFDPIKLKGVRKVTLTDAQYEQLSRSIRESLALDASDGPRLIEGRAYHRYDAFYEAIGAYHCFNTCNSWVGRRLADAGAPTPLFTPLPGMPVMYLPE